MKKFLKLIAENQPGEGGEYTVTLTDPSGRVENQFTITGGDFAFDGFQAFKEEMVGVSEDGEMSLSDALGAVAGIPDQGLKKNLLSPTSRALTGAKKNMTKAAKNISKKMLDASKTI